MSLRSKHPYFLPTRAVLNGSWSPIGPVPEDEYDRWSWQVVKLLQAGADRSAIAAYLTKARDEFFDESSADQPTPDDFEAADLLVQIRSLSD